MESLTIEIPATWPSGSNRILVIKSIREISGLDLKSAKGITDLPGQHDISYSYIKSRVGSQWSDQVLENHREIFQREGVRVYPSISTIIDSLRSLSARALDMGEVDLANDILQVLMMDRLRRM